MLRLKDQPPLLPPLPAHCPVWVVVSSQLWCTAEAAAHTLYVYHCLCMSGLPLPLPQSDHHPPPLLPFSALVWGGGGGEEGRRVAGVAGGGELVVCGSCDCSTAAGAACSSPQPPLQSCSCSIASAAVQSTCSSQHSNIFSSGPQHQHRHHRLLPAHNLRSVQGSQARLEAGPG